MAVACGEHFTLCVGEDGQCLGFGSNEYGVLGRGNETELFRQPTLTPEVVPHENKKIRQVSAGWRHMAMVTDEGEVLVCGLGEDGRLGLGDQRYRWRATVLDRARFDGEAVLMIDCGYSHSAAVTEGGSLYTFGGGAFGKLGHGNQDDQHEPRQVPPASFSGEKMVMVSCGFDHTIALSEAGHVFTWGDGNFGQLGNGNLVEIYTPTSIDAERFGGEAVIFVGTGHWTSFAVTESGQLYTWGYGRVGQHGHGDNANRSVPTRVQNDFAGSPVVMAAGGGTHTLVVTQDGGLWSCGDGRNGQLGLDDTDMRRVFHRINPEAFGGARVVVAAGGDRHSAAVTEDGALWTWGHGWFRKLGHNTTLNQDLLVPTRVDPANMNGKRIGRYHRLPQSHTLAFAMSMHSRLGANSSAESLAGEPGLLVQISDFTHLRVDGRASESEALARLTGAKNGHF